MYKTKAYSAASATSPLASTTIPRRDPTERDVQIEILFCGICHSDLHYARNEWQRCHAHGLPVRARPRDRRARDEGRLGGDEVQGRRPRRRRLPGRLRSHLPQLPGRPRAVLPEPDAHLRLARTSTGPRRSPTAATPTASSWTSTSSCASRPTSTSPGPRRCCAPGSRPIRRCATGTSARARRSAWSGLGGLGHMGVKFARAFGAHVVVFTTSPSKTEDALRLGADEVVVSRNADEMKKHAGSFDFILDTVAADHDINAYLNLLGRDGNLTLVGAPEKPLAGLCVRPDLRPPQPLRLAHRRHRRDPGDARLLRHSTTSPRTSKSSRSRRSTKPTSGCSSPT